MSGRVQRTQSQIKDSKPKHKPSTTPTGLPGDEPKPVHKKRPKTLGQIVDTLLVPEHKAARRLIRRNLRRNPGMASESNMTLYERIMAYRLLKQTGAVGGEVKDDVVEDDPRKVERSDTGWGSVDISQYTNKKDSDDNRSPTPPPTLTDPLRNEGRLKKAEENGAMLTSRDVHVVVEDKTRKQERVSSVKSNTSKKKRTPTPLQERVSSRSSSELNRLIVLPPIQSSREEKVTERNYNASESVSTSVKREEITHIEEKSKEHVRLDIKNDVKQTNNVIVLAKNEHRNESSKMIHVEDIKKEDIRKHEDIHNSRTERRISKEKGNDEKINVKEEIVVLNKDKSDEKKHSAESRRTDDEEEEKNDKRLQDSRAQDATLTAAVMAPSFRKSPKDERQPEGQPKSQKDSPTPDAETPPGPSRSEADLPSRKSSSRESTSKANPPQKPDKSRNTPKRRTPMDDEIDKLDEMVDMDLNEIIQSLGNKERKPRNDEVEDKLKKKIFDSKFQSDMDNFLRDI